MSKKPNIRPLQDRVFIVPEKAADKTESGLIIPDAAKVKPSQGEVYVAGPGLPANPISVKKGDRVIYHKGVGQEYEIEGESYLVMRESDIIAKL